MQNAVGSVRWLPYLGQVSLLAALYFALAKASFIFAIPPGYATAVWPPSGIALAALLVLGSRVWPGVWLGATLANLTVEFSPFTAIAIGSGNTLEALAGAALVRRHIADTAPYFDRARNVVKFVAVAAVCSAIAATIGVGTLVVEGAVPWAEFVANWGTWWHGDNAGIIIITPLILTWSVRHAITWTPAKLWEAAGFTLSLLLVSYLVFGHGSQYWSSLPFTFLILPFIIWAAFRFTRREVTTAIAAVCAIAVWYTGAGHGPFALDSLNLSLLSLLTFIGTVVITGLVLSAAVAERSLTMAKLSEAMRELQEQARTDPLTGLANRRHLWESLQLEWIRSRRRKSPLAVVMIDLDHFKKVNDTFGHDAGDQVLVDVAVLLKAHVRASDLACRFGGEEFALVLPDVGLDAVRRRAEGIREAIGRLEPTHRERRLGRITASIGIALFPEHAVDPEALLRAADQALYEAKSTGRDRVVISSLLPSRPNAPKLTLIA